MNKTSIDIEQIVREVLRRIELHRAPARQEAVPRLSEGMSVVPAAPTPGQLELTGRVVSLRDVEGKLAGVHQVTAVADAVVTPAARDYLAQHDMQLTLRSSEDGHSQPTSLYLAAFATRFDTRQLCDELATCGVQCRLTEGGSLPMILRLLAPRLAVAANALLVTEEPEVATCAANRHSDIRAFVATDPASLAKARQAIGGNLLIVNRVKCPDHSIREMACDMARHPARVPAQWRAVL